MSLKIGIVGLPNVGKSTLFQALTKKQVDTSNYPFATIEPNVGIVEVPDERLHKLAALSKSKRVVPAVIEFVDIAGLVKGAHQGAGLGNQFLSHIREVDAIVEVVRAFTDERIHHVEATVEPERDQEIIKLELLMADAESVTKAITRFEKESKSGNKEAKKQLEKARELKSLIENLQRPNTKELIDLAHELTLLSAKPVLTVYNVLESDTSPENKHTLPLNIKLEEELANMTLEEQRQYALEPKISQLITKAYELLNLISYFTTGESESRAWTIPVNSTAKRAGRAIHSDFEEKFIRAEIIACFDLIRAGSYAKAREEGLVRTEGKEYIVKDGDVIEFKI